MKKLLALILLTAAIATFSACTDTDSITSEEYYADWRIQNEEWLAELQTRTNEDGTPYYEVVIPNWNPGVYVLMHFFNDRTETADNLSPLYTSVVDTRYIGRDCEGEAFDSSTTVTTYGKLGIARFGCNEVIQGWTIALENMHVGDTAEIICPYNVAYGTTGSGSILPYSALQFNLRLEDIYTYETN